AFAPQVFEQAGQADAVAQRIVSQAAEDLGGMVADVLEKVARPQVPIYLIGGVFNAPGFVEQLQASPSVAASVARWAPVWHRETLMLLPAEILVRQALQRL
ncbi:MAG TPA: hypothetical protein PLV25_07635, partial [Opitutales bacterium]|nr:hypothetical protein [Opitutales bacterium]